ncbi:gliding motility lipoprotein GldH [Sphingobacterium sp. Mn56C]
MNKFFFYSIITLCSLSSCSDNAYYEVNKPIENRSWSYENKPQFDIYISNKSKAYDVYINLRHTHKYEFSNIYLQLQEKGNNLQDTSYSKEIILAKPDGQWLGKTVAGLYEYQYLALKNIVFPDTGLYSFKIAQNMNESPLKGIVDVGLKVVKK